MTLNGATVDDNWFAVGGPNGASYFSRRMITANTTSPMSMSLSGGGTAAIPVDPGDVLSVAWWARKDPGGGPTPPPAWTGHNAGGGVRSYNHGPPQTDRRNP